MRAKKHRGRRAVVISLLIIIIITAIILDSRFRIVTSEYKLEYDNLPTQFEGFRIVQISDLHGMTFGKSNNKLIEKIRNARPDIIAITGDVIDQDGMEEYAKSLFTALAEIAPAYYVTGNHEWSLSSTESMLSLIRSCGVTVLQNNYVILERSDSQIAIVGIDDPCGRADMERPEHVMARLRDEYGDIFSVMLNHRNRTPDIFYDLGADLALCGHAHGGLIRLPFTDGVIDASREWFPQYTNGVYEYEDIKVLVSRGLGNSVAVPRFLNNAHLPVAVLTRG